MCSISPIMNCSFTMNLKELLYVLLTLELTFP